MDCKEVRLRLQAFLDQALTAEESEGLEGHLYQCDGCWQEMITMSELPVNLHDPELHRAIRHEPAPLPADFTREVMSQIEAEQPTGVRLVWPWLRRRWSRKQVASVAYAMSATMVVVSAGNLLFLWNETTNRLGALGDQLSAYWEAVQAHAVGLGVYTSLAWQALLDLLRLGAG